MFGILELEAGQDAWKMADQTLNGAIGYGKTVEDIAKMIRRGPRGMDKLCNKPRYPGRRYNRQGKNFVNVASQP